MPTVPRRFASILTAQPRDHHTLERVITTAWAQ